MTTTDSELVYSAVFDQVQQCGDIISSILIIYKFVTENSIKVSFNTDDLRQIALRSVHNDTSTYLWHINALIAASSDFEHLLLGIEMMMDRFLGNKHLFIKEKQKHTQSQRISNSNSSTSTTKVPINSGTICMIPSSSQSQQQQQQQQKADDLRFDQGAHRALQQQYDEETERANIHRFLGNEVISFVNTRYDFQQDAEMKGKQSEQRTASSSSSSKQNEIDTNVNRSDTNLNFKLGNKPKVDANFDHVVYQLQYVNDENANHNQSSKSKQKSDNKSSDHKKSFLTSPGNSRIEMDDNSRDYMQKYRGKISSPISFRMRQQKRMMQSERRVTSRNAANSNSNSTSAIDLSGKLQSIQDDQAGFGPAQGTQSEDHMAMHRKFKTFEQDISGRASSFEPQILSPFNVSKFAKRVDLISGDMDSSQFQRKNV